MGAVSMHPVLAGHVREDERRALACLELKESVRVAAAHLDRSLGLECDSPSRALEEDAAVVPVGAVLRAPEVKPGSAFELEAHPAAHAEHATNQPVAMRPVPDLPDRHEILDLADSGRGEEARDEHVRVREVELLVLPFAACGPEHETAAAVRIEQRGEHARRVEPRAAVPVHRPLGADQRDRAQVADHSVVGDRRIRHRYHVSMRLFAADRAPSRAITWSPMRSAFAIAVSDGLMALEDGKKLVSTT